MAMDPIDKLVADPYSDEVHGSVVKAGSETVTLERSEALETPVQLGRNRWWFVLLFLMLMAFSIAFAVMNQPKVTTTNPSVTSLPRPEWWQVLIGVVIGLAFGLSLAVYIIRFVNFDVVTSL